MVTTVADDENKVEEERISRSWLVVRVMSVDVELLSVKSPGLDACSSRASLHHVEM